MRRYQSHKIVEAGKISRLDHRVEDQVWAVWLDIGDGKEDLLLVPDKVFARGHPGTGDYLVRYAPDGYLSWSPAQAFEDGYTLLEEA